VGQREKLPAAGWKNREHISIFRLKMELIRACPKSADIYRLTMARTSHIDKAPYFQGGAGV